jgi:galactitol-specific phosphotransferase system IIC component
MPEKFDFHYRLGCSVFGLVVGILFGLVLGLLCVASECMTNPLPFAVFGLGLIGAMVGLIFPTLIFAFLEGVWRMSSRLSGVLSKHEGKVMWLGILCCLGVVLFVCLMLFVGR